MTEAFMYLKALVTDTWFWHVYISCLAICLSRAGYVVMRSLYYVFATPKTYIQTIRISDVFMGAFLSLTPIVNCFAAVQVLDETWPGVLSALGRFFDFTLIRPKHPK